MKYLVNLLKVIPLFLFQLLVTAVGFIVIPFFLRRVESFECLHSDSMPAVKFKDSWIDAIFGNSEDGLDGDCYFKKKYSEMNLWTRYIWTASRNPIHNLALKMGVNEVITAYNFIGNRYTEDSVGREGYVYSEAFGKSGKVYPMFRYCVMYKGAAEISNVLRFIGAIISFIYLNIKACYFFLKGIMLRKYEKFSRVPFNYAPIKNCGIELNIGYKNFNIIEINKFYSYSFTVSCNPLKKFEE